MRTAGSSLLPPGGGEEDPAEPAEGLLQRRRPSSQRFVLSGRTSLPVKHSGLAGGALASHITTPTPTPTPRSGPRKERPSSPCSPVLIPHLHRSPATGQRSADLFDGDGPATPDAVHLAVSRLLLPVQVGTLSRLQEKRRGVLNGPRVHGGQQPTWTPLPSPPPSSWAGPSSGAGPGRRDREGTETMSIPTGLFLHTAPYRAAQVTEPGPPLTKEQGHGIPRARGAHSPEGWGIREGRGRGEVDGGAEGRQGARGTITGESKVQK